MESIGTEHVLKTCNSLEKGVTRVWAKWPPGDNGAGKVMLHLEATGRGNRFCVWINGGGERIVKRQYHISQSGGPEEPKYLSSVQFSCSVMSDSLQPHGPQHTRPPCPSPDPRIYSNSCPLSHEWCHPTISSSVIPFSSFLQSFPAPGSFQMNQLFASGGQSIGVSASASVLPLNTQDWSPLGWTGWISLQSKGLSSVFSNTTVQKHQFFSAQFSL